MNNENDGMTYDIIMKTEVKKELSGVLESNKAKTEQKYCEYGLGKLREKVPLKSLLLTCNLTPETVYPAAWDIVHKEREIIIKDLLKKYKEIYFAVSAIEHHHTISDKMKGRKTEKEIGTEATDIEEEIKEGSIYEAYTSKTMVEFLEKTKNWKVDYKVTRDMTEKEKVVTYYNVYQTLHYLNGESKRDDDFKHWISEGQTGVEALMYIKEENLKEIKWTDFQNVLISKHKSMGNNLLGYPHIHIAIVYAGIADPEKFRKEIFDYLMEKNIFPDPDVAPTKEKNSETEGKAILYVLKNKANKYVRDKFRMYGYDENIIRWYINNTIYEKECVEFAKGFMIKNGSDYSKVLPIDLLLRKRPVATKGRRLVIVNETVSLDPEKNNYNRTLKHILETMEKNETVICDGQIFKKRKDTKMTYERYMGIEEYLNDITTSEPYNIIAAKWKGELLKIMKLSDEVIEKGEKLHMGSAEGNYKVKFPRIKMDYRMIEFKDFYFNTITTEIYKEQTKYYCHYYSGVTLDDLENKIKYFEETSVWASILKNNGTHIYNKKVLSMYFSLLRPRIQKGYLLTLWGESNSGKTESIKPFTAYYPSNKVSTFVSTMSEYHVADLLVDRELSVWEEANGILNCETGARSRILAAMEGGVLVANKKHGEITNFENRANMILSTNILKTDKYHHDDAMMNRVLPVGEFKNIKNAKIVRDRIKQEEPYIYLLTGLAFMQLGKEDEEGEDNKENNNFFRINEIMTEEQEKELESDKRYYNNERDEDEEKVDICSKEYLMKNKINNMKKKDDNRRVIYEKTHKSSVLRIKNHPIHNEGIDLLEIKLINNIRMIEENKMTTKWVNETLARTYKPEPRIEDVTNKT